MMNTEFQIFAIGDLHIESVEQSRIFANYINRRAGALLVLLGDAIHFANSIWSASTKQVSRAEFVQNLDKDVSIWEDFLVRLKVSTVYYLGCM